MIEIMGRWTWRVRYQIDGATDMRDALERAAKQGLDLREANFCRGDLNKAQLANADLQGAYFTQAYLNRAELMGANLRSANLERADLSGANLCGADVTGASLEGSWWYNAKIVDIKGLTDEWRAIIRRQNEG